MTIAANFEYIATNGFPAKCRIQIVAHRGKTFLIVTDVGEGPSVTNNVERIANFLHSRGFRWDTFIEHYPERGHPQDKIEETVDYVTFITTPTRITTVPPNFYSPVVERPGVHFDHPTWKHATVAEVEKATGFRFGETNYARGKELTDQQE